VVGAGIGTSDRDVVEGVGDQEVALGPTGNHFGAQVGWVFLGGNMTHQAYAHGYRFSAVGSDSTPSSTSS
jgi:hypothetical protein